MIGGAPCRLSDRASAIGAPASFAAAPRARFMRAPPSAELLRKSACVARLAARIRPTAALIRPALHVVKVTTALRATLPCRSRRLGDQSRPPAIGGVRPRADGHHDDAVLETDQIPNVNDEPCQPCNEAAQAHAIDD